jgi:hypothetical protein
MDDDELRALLARVKAGEVSPEEAAVALGGRDVGADDPNDETDADDDEADDEAPPRRRDAGPRPRGGDGFDFSGVRIVRLKATANRTKVVGDPSVRTVQVTGPHRLRVEGDRVIVENEIGDENIGFGEGRHIRISGIRGAKIQGFRGHETLVVRVNPSMPVDFDCDAGMIEVLGVAGTLTGRVNAANAIIEDFEAPFHLSVNAGKLRARGRLDGGQSSIDVNVGKADVILEPGSNVRIIRSATLGSAEADDDIVGSGSGTLRVTCSLGAVRVHSPEDSLR